MSNLLNKNCEPCTGNTPKMELSEIKKNLLEVNNWKLNENKEMIFKKFNFKNFKKSLQFTNAVGNIAEVEGHHPDIIFGWGYAKIKIFTHKIKGLVESDFILAAKIDKISV